MEGVGGFDAHIHHAHSGIGDHGHRPRGPDRPFPFTEAIAEGEVVDPLGYGQLGLQGASRHGQIWKETASARESFCCLPGQTHIAQVALEADPFVLHAAAHRKDVGQVRQDGAQPHIGCGGEARNLNLLG